MEIKDDKLKGNTPGQMLLALAINKVRANKAKNLIEPVSEINQGVIDMNKQAYNQGFIDKCKSMGVDPNQFIKQSGSIGELGIAAKKLLGAIVGGARSAIGPRNAGEDIQGFRKTMVNSGRNIGQAGKDVGSAIKGVAKEYPKSTIGAAGAAGIGVGAAGTSALDRHVTPANKPPVKSTKPAKLKKQAGGELSKLWQALKGTGSSVGKMSRAGGEVSRLHAAEGFRFSPEIQALRQEAASRGGAELAGNLRNDEGATTNLLKAHPYYTAADATAGGIGAGGLMFGGNKEACDAKSTKQAK